MLLGMGSGGLFGLHPTRRIVQQAMLGADVGASHANSYELKFKTV